MVLTVLNHFTYCVSSILKVAGEALERRVVAVVGRRLSGTEAAVSRGSNVPEMSRRVSTSGRKAERSGDVAKK